MSTGEPPTTPPDREPRWVDRARATAIERAERATAWASETHQRRLTFDLAVDLRNRDRETFAAVLGSAIALRLFLFTASLVVVIVALLNLLLGEWGTANVLTGSGVTAQVADQVAQAASASTGRDIGWLASGVFLLLLSGRSLAKVLVACSAGAWRLGASEARATVRVAARVTGLVALLVIAGSGVSRLRDAFGVAVATGSMALNVVVLASGWFFVCRALPRPTRDPGAMLPGAALFGIALTLVQWFMLFYLPRRIASASEVMGSIGFTVATLGYLFLIGRIMAGSLVVNAVVWERFGSITEVVFALPLVRKVPARFPAVARFFDLEATEPEAGESGQLTQGR